MKKSSKFLAALLSAVVLTSSAGAVNPEPSSETPTETATETSTETSIEFSKEEIKIFDKILYETPIIEMSLPMGKMLASFRVRKEDGSKYVRNIAEDLQLLCKQEQNLELEFNRFLLYTKIKKIKIPRMLSNIKSFHFMKIFCTLLMESGTRGSVSAENVTNLIYSILKEKVVPPSASQEYYEVFIHISLESKFVILSKDGNCVFSYESFTYE